MPQVETKPAEEKSAKHRDEKPDDRAIELYSPLWFALFGGNIDKPSPPKP